MIAARTTSTRETMTDAVPQTRIYRVWNVPQYGSDDVERLQLFAQVLGGSRVLAPRQAPGLHSDKIVDSISAAVDSLASWAAQFFITADVKTGVDPAEVEKAIDEELTKLLAEGPNADELDAGAHGVPRRLRARHRAHRRLRRQGRRAGRVRGVHRRPGLLPRQR